MGLARRVSLGIAPRRFYMCPTLLENRRWWGYYRSIIVCGIRVKSGPDWALERYATGHFEIASKGVGIEEVYTAGAGVLACV